MPKTLRLAMWSMVAALLGFALLTSHSDASSTTRGEFPAKLSGWGLIHRDGNLLKASSNGVTYELASPLFSDYTLKWRVMFIPKGAKASYDPDRAFDLPVGTVIAKTFYYPVKPAGQSGSDEVLKPHDADYQSGVGGLRVVNARLMETRLLVRRAEGWVALPYVWDEDQRDATLERVGDAIPLTFVDGAERKSFVYVVPNANDCANCHAPNFTKGEINRIEPIGIKARHLNRDFPGAFGNSNQIARLARLGYLTGVPAANTIPANLDWRNEALPLDSRARSYLDINCSHCHSPVGAARTTGLWFDQGHEHGSDWASPRRIGVCKQIVAGGHGGGGLPFDVAPGEPEKSILLYRVGSDVPGTMMPEIGRSLVHAEGLALLRNWITRMDGKCRLASESQ